MGAWRALMSRARWRTRHPFLSCSILSEIDHKRPCPFPLNARFETLPDDACTRENERIWPALFSGVPKSSQEARHDEALFKDAKEFLQLVKKDLRRLDLGSTEYYFQASGQRNSWLHGNALGQEREPLALSAGASVDSMNSFSRVTISSNEDDGRCMLSPFDSSPFDSSISAPGFYGSEDLSIQVDSVKRKRKKKMNKHKHRKLRRLARRSRK